MSRICRAVLTTVLGAFLLFDGASAQTRLEIRGGLAVGSHTATAAGFELVPALSFDVLFVRQIKPGVSVLGGFSRTAFGCEEGFCLDRDLTVVGNHVVLGGELRGGSPWLRMGLLVGSTEVGTEGEAPETGVGVHAAAGFTIGSGRVRFLPGASYRWLSANTPSSSDHAVALAFDLGVSVRLGASGRS